MTHGWFRSSIRALATIAIIYSASFSIRQAVAQQPGPSGQPPATAAAARELLNQAYSKTKTAKELAHFSEIVDLCRQALIAGPSQKDDQYIRRLLAWASNKRGEEYADQAVVAADDNEAEQVERLERLALADFEAAVKYDPQAWRAVHNRGISYAQQGKLEEAIAQFDRVIQLKEDYANAWFDRGELQYELGRYEKAVADYSQALRLNPDDVGVHTSRGHAYYQLGRFEQALADYTRAVAIDDEKAEAYVNRADAFQSLGKWEQAAADYRRAIELNDQLGRAYQSAAWLMATCPDQRFRDVALAIQAAQKAIQLDGESPNYLDALAAAFANAGKFEQAQATLAKVLDMTDEDADERLLARLKFYQQSKPYRQATREASEMP